MAIQKTVTLTNSFNELSVINNAYIKVTSVLFSKEKARGVLQYMREKDTNPLVGNEFEFTPTVGAGAKDPIAQAYEHLKTLPEFSDAVDC